ncbi:MAG TPA: hypothetical protein VGQ81_07995 [Acidobacteriota bacterium]|nr:hypothetical protein [Acidobacteriota bacterium]
MRAGYVKALKVERLSALCLEGICTDPALTGGPTQSRRSAAGNVQTPEAAQQRSEERINVLINGVERYFSNGKRE